MKRKVALQGLALILALGTTTNVFANGIKVEIIGGGNINIYNNNNNNKEQKQVPPLQEETEENNTIPYKKQEYPYLMINFTEPFTEQRYNQLIENNESFVVSDSRLKDNRSVKSPIYLNSSNFPDEHFRNDLINILQVSEGADISDKIITVKELFVGSGFGQKINDITGIQYFTYLEKAIINGTGKIQGLSSVSRLNKLKYLGLRDYDLTNTNNYEIYLKNIEQLEFVRSTFSDSSIQFLANLTNVKILDLGQTEGYTDLPSFNKLTKLTTLDIYRACIDNYSWFRNGLYNLVNSLPSTTQYLNLEVDNNGNGDNIQKITNNKVIFYDEHGQYIGDTPSYESVWRIGKFRVKPGGIPLSIKSVTIRDKVYDGTNNAIVENIEFNGILGGNTLLQGYDYNVVATFENGQVGNNKKVNIYITPLNNGNMPMYILNSNFFQTTGNIIKGNSSIQEIKIKNGQGTETKIFDFSDKLIVEGTPKQRTNLNKIKLILNNQIIATQDATLNNKVTFNIDLNNLNIGQGSYELKLRYGGNDNLNGTEESLGNITINKVKVKGEINENIIYNGTNTFQVNLKNIKNKNNNELISNITGTATVILDNKNIGSYNKFNVSNIKFVGDTYNHFEIENVNTDIIGNINIVKKPITIKSAVVENKKYDGNTNANITNIQFNDLIGNESLTKDIDFNVNANFDNKNVGEDKLVTISVELLDTEKANNYQITETFQTTANIIKANSTIDSEESIQMKKEFTYGDIIDINVIPKIEKSKSLDFDKIQLIYNDEVLATGNYNIESSNYKLSYNTEDKKLPISNNIPITIRFTGNNNLNSSEYNTTISLKPKEITATYNLDYVYDNESIKETNLQLNGLLPKDRLNIIAKLYLDENTLNVNDKVIVKNIEYTINDNYYILPKENITGNIIINKANIKNQKSILNIINKLEKDYIFNLEENLPILENNKTFGKISFNNLQYNKIEENYLKENPILQDNNLKVKVNEINSQEEKLVGTITLVVKSTNYNDFELNIDLCTTNKIKPNLNVIQKEDLTYGDNLNKLILDYKATYENEIIDGILKINEDLDQILNAGTHKINVTFIPNDNEKYDLVNTYTNVKINKALAKAIQQPKIIEINSDGNLLSNSKFLTNGKFEGINKEILSEEDYILKWEDENQVVIENKAYKYNIVNNNYYIDEELTPFKKDNENSNSGGNNNGNGSDIGNKPEVTPNPDDKENNKDNSTNDNIFEDLDDNHWAKDKIQDLVNKGIVKGYKGLIRPNEPITRAEFAVLLNNTCNYLGVDTNNISNDIYIDVLKSKYYYNDVYKATYLDTMIGYNDKTFKPDNNLIRQEAIVSIYKLIVLCNINIELSYPTIFNDYNDISIWAKPYFNELNSKGILKGYNNSYFNPKQDITRAEAFVLIYNILNN